jgi:two-component system chemotaxis sensor kinase CheA
MDEFVSSFIEESKELLLQLEEDLISLEKNPSNVEIINNIFRVMHNLKGSAGMLGFKNIQDLTHEFENIYAKIRDGKLPVDSEIINITLKGKDLIFNILDGANQNEDYSDPIEDVCQIVRNKTKESSSSGAYNSIQSNEVHLYVIFFSPERTIFERGLDPDKVIYEIKNHGRTYILLHENNKSWEEQKREKTCVATWEIYLSSYKSLKDIMDVFLFYNQDSYEVFDITNANTWTDSNLREKYVMLYGIKKKAEKQIQNCIQELRQTKDNDIQKLAEKKTESVQKSQKPEYNKSENCSIVSVPSHKLDELMNLVSEMVTLTATIASYSNNYKDSKLENAIENIEKLTKKFRNNALDLRLVPVGNLLSRFKRQIRDLSRELGKRVEILIEGQEIEIDKSILKSIESPLQHIIRNSLDHGIETEDVRISKGKSPEGLIKISAFHSGANAVIQVQDDGGGIELERVRECATTKGLIQKDQVVTKQELISFILEPGFTTAENVSIVSGRGVGMDVVRKELSVVGGSLEIFTEKDLGTSIIMKLPTTLTIIDTLMVDVGETQVLIPIMDIEYCYKDRNEHLFEKDNKYIQFKNNPIPLVSLRGQFGYPASDQNEIMVIVINKFDRRYAITTDRIIGEHQAVIKPLGELFVNQHFFSGGSIMVDGKLALILDTNFLYNQVNKM